MQEAVAEPRHADVAVGIPVYPPVAAPGAAAAVHMHSLADTAPPAHARGPSPGALHHSHMQSPYDGLGASWPGPGMGGGGPGMHGSMHGGVQGSMPGAVRGSHGPHAHSRYTPSDAHAQTHPSAAPAGASADPAAQEGHAMGMANDAALWQAKPGLARVRTSPPQHADNSRERSQVSEIAPAGSGGAAAPLWEGGPAHGPAHRGPAGPPGSGVTPGSQRHVSWPGAPMRRGPDELDNMHGRHASALSWSGDAGLGRERHSVRAESDMSEAALAAQLYRTNESDASGRGPPVEGHSGKSSGRGVAPGLSAMNSTGTVSVDENDAAGFNAGKLAEVAAIQVWPRVHDEWPLSTLILSGDGALRCVLQSPAKQLWLPQLVITGATVRRHVPNILVHTLTRTGYHVL